MENSVNSLLQVYKQAKTFNIADLQNNVVSLINLVPSQPLQCF